MRRLKKGFLFLVMLYFGITALLYFFQENILFRPTVLAQDFEYQFTYQFEELFLKPSEDVVVNALHFKVVKPKGVILYFHGNAGNLSRWGTITEHFVALGYDVLVMDYRTYGKSRGELSEEGLYNDAQFCYEYLKKSYSEQDIIVYGRSLGTAIATYVASKNKPKSLILETPYYSITDVAKHRFPIFPVEKLSKYELPTYQFIKNVSCDILMLHGTDDEVIPIASAKKLKGSSHKATTFIEIENGNHNNLVKFKEYQQAIKEVLN